MKKRVIALLLLLCICSCSCAEESSALELEGTYHNDLDGNGTEEEWMWTDVEDERGWDNIHRLTVIDDNREQPAIYDISTWMWYSPVCYLADMNGDGIQEMFVTAETGENYSYTTWCLNYSNGTIEEVMFADTKPHSDAYFTYFPGYIKEVNNDRVSINAYTDVLGSWRGCWSFEMNDRNRLQPADDGWCMREFNDPEEDMDMDAYWEYTSLTLEMEMAYRSGDQVGVLYPGDRILITGTDHYNIASFIKEDGVEGQLYIQSKAEDAFGWMVNVNSEEELRDSYGYIMNMMDENIIFDVMPYAG